MGLWFLAELQQRNWMLVLRPLLIFQLSYPGWSRGSRGSLGRPATWPRRQEFGVDAAALQLSAQIHTIWIHISPRAIVRRKGA